MRPHTLTKRNGLPLLDEEFSTATDFSSEDLSACTKETASTKDSASTITDTSSLKLTVSRVHESNSEIAQKLSEMEEATEHSAEFANTKSASPDTTLSGTAAVFSESAATISESPDAFLGTLVSSLFDGPPSTETTSSDVTKNDGSGELALNNLSTDGASVRSEKVATTAPMDSTIVADSTNRDQETSVAAISQSSNSFLGGLVSTFFAGPTSTEATEATSTDLTNKESSNAPAPISLSTDGASVQSEKIEPNTPKDNASVANSMNHSDTSSTAPDTGHGRGLDCAPRKSSEAESALGISRRAFHRFLTRRGSEKDDDETTKTAKHLLEKAENASTETVETASVMSDSVKSLSKGDNTSNDKTLRTSKQLSEKVESDSVMSSSVKSKIEIDSVMSGSVKSVSEGKAMSEAACEAIDEIVASDQSIDSTLARYGNEEAVSLKSENGSGKTYPLVERQCH